MFTKFEIIPAFVLCFQLENGTFLNAFSKSLRKTGNQKPEIQLTTQQFLELGDRAITAEYFSLAINLLKKVSLDSSKNKDVQLELRAESSLEKAIRLV